MGTTSTFGSQPIKYYSKHFQHKILFRLFNMRFGHCFLTNTKFNSIENEFSIIFSFAWLSMIPLQSESFVIRHSNKYKTWFYKMFDVFWYSMRSHSLYVFVYTTRGQLFTCASNRTKNRKENIFNIEDSVCGWVFIVWTCFRFNEFVFVVLFSYIIFLFVERNNKYLIQIIK